MLKSLGFAKKRPPTDTQIRKHRDQVRVFSQWKDDLSRINAITSKLGNAYKHHKGDFALGRYEELKQMIKDAIKEFHEVMEKSQRKSRDATSALASKYSGNSSAGRGNSVSNQPPPQEEKSGVSGLFNKLKKTAAGFASSSSSSSSSTTTSSTRDDRSKDGEMETWGYEGRKAKEIEEETESMRKEVLQMKTDFRSQRDKLEHLAKEYEDSKKHAPPQRYTVLKYMIKDVVGA